MEPGRSPAEGSSPVPSFPEDVHGAWDGAEPAAATSPVAQLSHSPACSGWASSTSSGCHAGAAPAPFSSSSSLSTQASLGTQGYLFIVPLRPGLEGSCCRDGRCLGKAPLTRVGGERGGCAGTPRSPTPSCPVASRPLGTCGVAVSPPALISRRVTKGPVTHCHVPSDRQHPYHGGSQRAP